MPRLLYDQLMCQLIATNIKAGMDVFKIAECLRGCESRRAEFLAQLTKIAMRSIEKGGRVLTILDQPASYIVPWISHCKSRRTLQR